MDENHQQHGKRLLPKAFISSDLSFKRLKGDLTSLEVNKAAYISKPIFLHSTNSLASLPHYKGSLPPPPAPPPSLVQSPCPPKSARFPHFTVPEKYKMVPAKNTNYLTLRWIRMKDVAKHLVARKAKSNKKPGNDNLPKQCSSATIATESASVYSHDSRTSENTDTDISLRFNFDQLQGALLYIIANEDATTA